MMYSVGDKVVHPGYGPGVITSIEHRQVIGEAKQYYLIDMLAGSGTLMTPVAQADKVGLRLAVSEAVMEELLQSLAKPPRTLSGDFRERQAEVVERLREGDIFVTAEVIRDLAWFGQVNALTKRDQQIMQRAQELLAGELALIREIEVKEAIGLVQAVLDEVMSE